MEMYELVPWPNNKPGLKPGPEPSNQFSQTPKTLGNLKIINTTNKGNIMNPVINFTSFVRRPFVVEAVQITEENIDELAAMLGEVKIKDDEKHILLDRRIVPNIKRAFIGWWVTKLDDNLRCYSPKVFEKEFTIQDDNWTTYFDQVIVDPEDI